MYRVEKHERGQLKINNSRIGESIETYMERLMQNGASDINEKEEMYTDPTLGVQYATDIRGDRFDEAIRETDKITATKRATREGRFEERKKVLEEAKKGDKKSPKDSEAEPIGGTSEGAE